MDEVVDEWRGGAVLRSVSVLIENIGERRSS